MKTTMVVLSSLAVLLLSATTAGAQDELIRAYERPGEFFLDGPMRKMVAHVKSPKHFRLCIAKGEPAVPVVVEYDKDEHEVQPGDCFDFEASKVWVKQGKPLSERAVDEGYIVTGTLHKVK